MWLSDHVAAIHEASHGTYGALQVRAELVHAQGVTVGHNTVALLVRRAGLTGLPLRRGAKKVPASITVADLVRRQFARPGPNQLWVTDITEHPTLGVQESSQRLMEVLVVPGPKYTQP